LSFSGRPTVTIPANAIVYSDPVALAIPALSDLAVDLYLPGKTDASSPLTMHPGAFQTNYISQTGDHAGETAFPTEATISNWFLLTRVDVVAPDAAGEVVAVGDSITDGTRSTPNSNNRWPDLLAKRLLSLPQPVKLSVLNAGIAANRVLSEGNYAAGINVLARFDTDVLSIPGLTHIILLEGINDIGNAKESPTPSADDIIVAYQQMIVRAHARSVKIYAATLTPFWGAAYYTDVGEAKRQAVNQWIRTSKALDGMIDFDTATRDPSDPKKFLAQYDSCDHLHPSDAGYQAMANAINLNLFNSSR
jgi:lysophospholipase L1-like esterase